MSMAKRPEESFEIEIKINEKFRFFFFTKNKRNDAKSCGHVDKMKNENWS